MNPDVPRSGVATHTSSYFFVQTIPVSGEWKYKNKTVMLIDERTIDEAEHTGLFLEAANKTAFIGSPSAGADGDVNGFVVPGGVTIHFSARDVRHANGGKLQRLGLQPSVSVSPTIKGIRDGRDEVLEKALGYLAKPQ
jgi:C-terminal processing protease CtpA/Prc